MFLIRVLLVNFLLVASAIANSAVGKLNHYSDYGVVEQSGITSSDAVSINNDPFGYSDEYTDNESGLQYLQVRYYNPTIMRFTAMDTYPLLNRYAYANENPIMNDDPSGHSASTASGAAVGILSAIGMSSSVALGVSGVVTMNPVAIVALVAFVGEGVMITTQNLDTDLSAKAAKNLGIAIDVVDMAGNLLDTGAAYYDIIKDSTGALFDNSKKIAFHMMRVFTDLEPTGNDAMSIAEANKSSGTYSDLETQLSMVNQFVAVANYFGRGFDEVSTAYDEGYGKGSNSDSSADAKKQGSQIDDKGQEQGDQKSPPSEKEAQENKIYKDYKERAAKRMMVFQLARRAILEGFRFSDIYGDINASIQEQQQN